MKYTFISQKDNLNFRNGKLSDVLLKDVTLYGTNKIPEDTPLGFYYLGAGIDAGDKVSESDEWNNVDFYQIEVIEKTENQATDAYALENFGATTMHFSFTEPIQTIDNECSSRYGNGARAANWNELVNFKENGGDLDALLNTLWMNEVGSILFINKDNQHWSNTGRYIMKRNDWVAPDNSLDSLDMHKIDLETTMDASSRAALCYIP